MNHWAALWNTVNPSVLPAAFPRRTYDGLWLRLGLASLPTYHSRVRDIDSIAPKQSFPVSNLHGSSSNLSSFGCGLSAIHGPSPVRAQHAQAAMPVLDGIANRLCFHLQDPDSVGILRIRCPWTAWQSCQSVFLPRETAQCPQTAHLRIAVTLASTQNPAELHARAARSSVFYRIDIMARRERPSSLPQHVWQTIC